MAVKANPAKKAASKKAARKSSSGGKRSPVWTFPQNTLEDAIRVARAIEEKHAGNPMGAALLARAVGFKQPKDWRFQNLLRSANLYGLVSGSGEKATVHLEKIGEDVVAPSSSGQRQNALLEAFRNVDEFRRVEEFYRNKRIPEDEYFQNTLTRTFDIPRERLETFTDVFRRNLEYLRAFDVRPDGETVVASAPSTEARPEETPQESVQESRPADTRIREFLDTCFVMMPFGEWFDRYFEEIYTPAIKEAGFEPIRADQLFSTGSVVEQIWEQVSKSQVLLADLTGKNANVFYELGLAHAAQKPVVLTTGSLEDVPFDLRHLRVIPYDVRAPKWADALQADITTYLKNAKAEPEKSIPQPFRPEPLEEE